MSRAWPWLRGLARTVSVGIWAAGWFCGLDGKCEVIVNPETNTDRLGLVQQPDWSGIGRMVLERARLATSAHLVERAGQMVDAVSATTAEACCLDEAR